MPKIKRAQEQRLLVRSDHTLKKTGYPIIIATFINGIIYRNKVIVLALLKEQENPLFKLTGYKQTVALKSY